MRVAFALALLLPLLALVAACGGESGDVLTEIKARGTLRVATEPTFRPFESVDENDQLVGFDIDLAKALAADLGVEVEFVTVDWNSIIPTLIGEKADVIMSGMTITDERKRTVDYSDPYFHTVTCLLLSKERAPGIEDVSALNAEGRKIVVKEGTTGHFAAEKACPKAEIIAVATENDAAREVVLGRADAFLYDLWSIRQHNRNHPDTTYVVAKAVTKEPYGIALRKGNPEARAWLNRTLGAMREDGRLQELYDKYGLENAD